MFKSKFFLPAGIALAALSATIVIPSSMASDAPVNEMSHVTEMEKKEDSKVDVPRATESVATLAQDSTFLLEDLHVPTRTDMKRFHVDIPEPEPVAETPALDTTAPAPQTAAAQAFQAPPVTSYGNDVVAAAMSRIGTPYAWGGNTPSGFDCSGLVQWAYQQVGKSIPRVSSAQIYGGTPVPLDKLQPGDIIGYGADIYHVGIYIGNGKIVHAPTFNQTVTTIDMHYDTIYGAVRY